MANPILDPALSPTADIPSAEAAPALTAPAVTPAWHPLTRFAFRAAFCYCLLYALCCGNATLWEIIPFHVGEFMSTYTAWPFQHAARWLGQHLFHLSGVSATPHGGGSGDTALDWIAVGVMLLVAAVATLAWTAIAETRTNRALAYPRLYFWMRLMLRLALGYAMLGYGMAKLFPLQMAPPSLAVLNEPLGHTSPMTMLWTLIGLNPVYEIICGATECVAGVLLLFRRTALVGTLLTVFLTTNIVLYNFCFDVPVKIYAAHLLLISLVLLTPSIPGLVRLFLLHQPAQFPLLWARPAGRLRVHWETLIIGVWFAIMTATNAWQTGQVYRHQQAAIAHPGPLTGIWQVDTAIFHGQPKPLLTPGGDATAALIFEPSGRAELRSASQELFRAGAHFDPQKHTLNLYSVGIHVEYAVTQPDANHLVLTPTGDSAKTDSTLTLSRVPLPASYPLLDRGFHFVNEWGLER